MKKNNKTPFILVICVFILLASCTKTNPVNPQLYNWSLPVGGGNSSTSITVLILNSGFSMKELLVKAGTRVTWINKDSIDHSIISNDGTSFNSGTIKADSGFSYTIYGPYSLGYHCGKHGESAMLTLVP